MKGWVHALQARIRWACGPRRQWLWVAVAAALSTMMIHESWLAPWLELEKDREPSLKYEYSKYLISAQGIRELETAKAQVLELVTLRERQLPGEANIDDLLSDVNQAALGRGVTLHRLERIESPDEIRDFYAMVSFTLVASGPFTGITDFLADVANLSRIVTLHHLHLVPTANRHVRLEATLVTYRYLTVDEVASQRTRVAKKSAGKQEQAK